MAQLYKYNKEEINEVFLHHLNGEGGGVHINYPTKLSQNQILTNVLGRVHHIKRKDINVVVSWVIESPKDFPIDRENEFFDKVHEFFENYYGLRNLVSSYVHKHGKSHIHFSFVPVVFDRERERYKVSAKDCIQQLDYFIVPRKLRFHLEQYFGFKVIVDYKGLTKQELLSLRDENVLLKEKVTELTQIIEMLHDEA